MKMIKDRKMLFENNAPFTSCISKISNTFIDTAENLDIVLSMYNLLEYRDNYSMISGSLWNYYTEMILMVSMIILQRVNHLSIKQK